MCGVTGFLASDRQAAGDEVAVRRMADAMIHRGPDAAGYWTRGPCSLGHRRLSIIDLNPEANQPLLNEDGQVAIVVNGEIYNYIEIRERLIAKGHTFRSHSDSEVIVHLYEEMGEACVAELQGMFAFVLYDARNQRVLIARDRAGQKPIFYRRLRHGVAFASEVGALVRGFPGERPKVNLAAIDEFLTVQYVPSPHTAYQDTYKLPAGHYAVFEPGKALPEPVAYWTKPAEPMLTGSAEELTRELRRLLKVAVKRRLMSDVPLGAFLSGGIDSSTVVAMMALQSTTPVKTFSVGFPDAQDSELPYARLIAKRYETEHHEEIVSPEMTGVVLDTVHHHGEPFADSSAVAMYYLSKMTRKHVTVALSGDAADENFAGYRRYLTLRMAHWYDALPEAGKRIYRTGLSMIGHAAGLDIAEFADRMPEDEALRYSRVIGQFTPGDKRLMYLESMRDVTTHATIRRFESLLASSRASSSIARLCDLDWKTYLIDDINVKVDIASMAHSLEVRCPFLDTDVVEFASRLPPQMLMRWRGKWILRRAIGDLLPRQILHRRKRGFALPLARWMRRDLREMTRDLLLDRRFRERGLFDGKHVEGMVAKLDVDNSTVDRLWTLLVLELWFREFVDEPATAQAA